MASKNTLKKQALKEQMNTLNSTGFTVNLSSLTQIVQLDPSVGTAGNHDISTMMTQSGNWLAYSNLYEQYRINSVDIHIYYPQAIPISGTLLTTGGLIVQAPYFLVYQATTLSDLPTSVNEMMKIPECAVLLPGRELDLKLIPQNTDIVQLNGDMYKTSTVSDNYGKLLSYTPIWSPSDLQTATNVDAVYWKLTYNVTFKNMKIII